MKLKVIQAYLMKDTKSFSIFDISFLTNGAVNAVNNSLHIKNMKKLYLTFTIYSYKIIYLLGCITLHFHRAPTPNVMYNATVKVSKS